MGNYKIIASDLDGTLLSSNADVSRENIDAIAKLCERGVAVVPCTGRTYSEIPPNVLNIPSNRYVIHSNGAVVYDRETDKRIFSRCISNDVARQLLDIFKTCECHITLRHTGKCFVQSGFQDEDTFEYYHMVEAHRGVIRDFAIHLNDLEKNICETDEIEMFSVFFRNREDKIRCRELIEQIQKLRVVEISEYNLEIVNVEAGKGNALREFADSLGVLYAETIGVGDSDNDTTLIGAAGLGLVPSNGCDSLKGIADEIICSNDEHVMKYILENYI